MIKLIAGIALLAFIGVCLLILIVRLLLAGIRRGI